MPNSKAIKLVLLLIISDQLIKYAAVNFLPWQLNPRTNVLAISLIIAWLFSRYRQHRGSFWLISGGVSNLIDRVARGGVVDYFHIFGIWFNLADLFIVGGTLSIVYSYWHDRHSRF